MSCIRLNMKLQKAISMVINKSPASSGTTENSPTGNGGVI